MRLTSYLEGKRILLLGLGREGRNSLDLVLTVNPEHVGIADQNPASFDDLHPAELAHLESQGKLTRYMGEDYLRSLDDTYDLVLKSPGITFRDFTRFPTDMHRLVRYPNLEVSGQADLLLRFSQAKIVGISGTKGKSTLTTLLYEIFSQSHEAYLRGNIGVPPLQDYEQMDNKFVALELSCHQLEFTRQSPKVAILTNLFPEHLDHYRDYDHYIESKFNLIANPPEEGMLVITAAEDPFVIDRVAQKLTKNHKIAWLTRDPMDFDRVRNLDLDPDVRQEHWWFEENVLWGPDGISFEVPQGPGLLGSHVLLNAGMACIAALAHGISVEDIQAASGSFEGLPHRCEKLGTFAGRVFYNDSIATIPHATLLAVDSLDQVSTLIVGGMDRGIDYEELIRELPDTSVRELIVLPETGSKIAEAIEASSPGRFKIHVAQTMHDAVRISYEHSTVGETILFSPAAASYHLYKDFAERGDDFSHEVRSQAEFFEA